MYRSWRWSSFRLPLGTSNLPPDPIRPPLNEAIQLEDRRLLRLSGVGRFTEVLEQGRARLRTGPRTCLLAELTAHSAERTGRLPELIEELQDVRRNEPLDNVLLFGQALALRLRQEDWLARNLLALAIRRGVPCHEAYQYFVELSQNQGRLGEADVVLEQLRAARDDDPRVLMARAHAWDLRGDVSKALAGYQQAILEAPPLAVTHRYYSRLLASTGQFERAAHSSRTGARLARALREPQQLAPLLTVEGISLDWMERYEESRGALEQALLVTRENNLFALEARILVELSILSGARGRMDDSLDYLARARALEDHVYLPADRIRYFLRLGNALASLGRSETAMGVLTESLALAEARGDKLMAVEARLQVARQMLASGEIAAAGLFRSSYAQAVVLDDGRGQARALSGTRSVLWANGKLHSIARVLPASVGADESGKRSARRGHRTWQRRPSLLSTQSTLSSSSFIRPTPHRWRESSRTFVWKRVCSTGSRRLWQDWAASNNRNKCTEERSMSPPVSPHPS